MKFRLVVECDAETARWSAVFPELPGCGSAGDTEEEAIAHAREALALWFEPTPVELHRGAKLLEVMLPCLEPALSGLQRQRRGPRTAAERISFSGAAWESLATSP